MRWHTIPMRACAFLLGAQVTYVVVMNLAMSTHALEAVVNRLAPAHVKIHYGSAYSLWFMRVHVKNFWVRGTDSSVEWRLAFDEATTTFDAHDFFARRVHMHDAKARGVVVRVRFKIDPSEATPDYVAKLPPIDGLPDPPLKPAVMPPDPDDAHYALWTAQLDDVVAEDVREVWTDSVRIVANKGRVAGGFYLKPLRLASLSPTTFRLENATVTSGTETVARDVDGAFRMTLRTLDMRRVEGRDAFRLLDLHARISATTGKLDFLNPWLVKNDVTIHDGTTTLRADVALDHGVMVEGSAAELDMSEWHVASHETHVAGSTVIHARVDRDHATATLETRGAALRHGRIAVAHADYIGVAARLDDLDLSRPIERWAVSVDAPRARLPNAAAVDAYIDAPIESGSATVAAHADVDPSGARGHAKVDFSSVALKLTKSSAIATGSADITLQHFDFHHDHGQASNVRIDLDDVTYDGKPGWWAHVASGPFAFDTKHGPSASLVLTGKCKDALVPLAVIGAPGIVSTFVGHQTFTVLTRATVTTSSVDASDIRVIGDSVELYAHYKTDARGKNGAGIVITGITNVGFEVLRGALSVRPFASRDWYERTRP